MTPNNFRVKNGLTVSNGIVVEAGVISGNGSSITSVNAATLNGNTAAQLREYTDSSIGTSNTAIVANASAAYTNAVSYTDTKIGTANSAITGNAATAYTNAVSYTDGKILTANSAITGNAATAYSNATSYTDTKIGTANSAMIANASAAYTNATTYASNASNISTGTLAFARLPTVDSVANTSVALVPTANNVKTAYDAAITANTNAQTALTAAGTAYTNAVSYTDTKIGTANTAMAANAAAAYTNAVSYTDGKILTANSAITGNAATAYTNATTYASNASNLSTGTVAEARLPYRMNQNVRTTDLVEFAGITLTGNLVVSGNVNIVGANNLSISDNMIYLNSNNDVNNPDLGFAGNYNDGTYHHAGFFRDATDGFWKVFDNYDPEPDANVYIDTTNTSFHIADFWANTARVGNTSVYATINSTTYSGSANNADYLDGQHGSYYTNATNISTGTLAAARLPSLYLGTTTIQSTSAAQAVTGITTLAAGNTTITGFANVSVSVNSAALSVGSSFVANTTQVTYGIPQLINNNQHLRFQTVNTSAYAYFTQQNDDNFVFYTSNTTYGARAVFSIFANSVTSTFNITPGAVFNGGIYANGSYGTSGQVLTTNGTGVYWSTASTGGVNVNSTYAWTNTHSFAANVTFANNISITSGNSTAAGGFLLLAGIADANWKIGRNTNGTTKWYYTNNSLDILAANSNLEGIVLGNPLVGGASYLETGHAGTYIAGNVTIGNTSSKSTINSTAFSGSANNSTYFDTATWAAPKAIGGGTANSGAFTTVTATSVSATTNITATANVSGDMVITANNGNGTNFKVGDDTWIGDINTADTLRIQGQQSANNGYIVFGNADTTSKLGRAGTGALTYTGNFAVTGNVNVSTINATSFGATITSNSSVAVMTIGNSSVSSTVNSTWFSGTSANADLLDGQHGSYYTNATNITTGTLPAARLPSLYLGTTAIQSTSAAQAVSGITTLAAGNTTISGWVTASSARGGVATPTAGQNNSALYVTGSDTAYGLLFGTDPATGKGWIQAQRTDATATTYNLKLNPAGGGVEFAGAVSGITTLAAGNTTITGFANVSVSVNSALVTVGSSVIANTSGLFLSNTASAVSNSTTITSGQAVVYASQNGGRPYTAYDMNTSQPSLYETRFVNFATSANVASGMSGMGYWFGMGAGDVSSRGFSLLGTSGSGMWYKEQSVGTWYRLLDNTNAYTISGVHTHSANVAMANNYIVAPVFQAYSEYVSTNATATGAITLDLSTSNFFNLTLTGNITPTFSNAPSGRMFSFTFVAKQDATGGRTITWPSGTKWPGGVAPPATTTANAIDIWSVMTYDGGSTWIASLSVKNAS